MKNNIILKQTIIFIISWILMGFVFAFVVWMFQGFQIAFNECLTYEGVWMITLFLGWIPGTIIASDVDDF